MITSFPVFIYKGFPTVNEKKHGKKYAFTVKKTYNLWFSNNCMQKDVKWNAKGKPQKLSMMGFFL